MVPGLAHVDSFARRGRCLRGQCTFIVVRLASISALPRPCAVCPAAHWRASRREQRTTLCSICVPSCLSRGGLVDIAQSPAMMLHRSIGSGPMARHSACLRSTIRPVRVDMQAAQRRLVTMVAARRMWTVCGWATPLQHWSQETRDLVNSVFKWTMRKLS